MLFKILFKLPLIGGAKIQRGSSPPLQFLAIAYTRMSTHDAT